MKTDLASHRMEGTQRSGAMPNHSCPTRESSGWCSVKAHWGSSLPKDTSPVRSSFGEPKTRNIPSEPRGQPHVVHCMSTPSWRSQCAQITCLKEVATHQPPKRCTHLGSDKTKLLHYSCKQFPNGALVTTFPLVMKASVQL